MLQINKRPVWKTVKGGSKEYVKKLLFSLKNLVIVKQPVWKVVRNARDVSIYTDNGKKEDFDEVVLACHSDQALNLVENLDSKEKEILKPFKYEKNMTTLHTDTSVLPNNKDIWASWNYRIPINNKTKVTVTYLSLIHISEPTRPY